ncbi:hypothetical protein BTN50_0045 [Candidatus Enterovibrio altilux]|uniref:Uncharacterized protein n=1 Tax=Candidatus Enterovibrio altilux TaxID=1927128 RepID=A0A291B6F9_9GAMM|nr:hypothetical protein BTN50_0045 [Candidatus Enterovibrio luxaltus]
MKQSNRGRPLLFSNLVINATRLKAYSEDEWEVKQYGIDG